MMKLAIIVLLVGVAAASGVVDVSSQSALINHLTPYGYGNGVSARYFDKVENRGYGYYGPLGYYGAPYYNGLAYDGPYYGRYGLGYGYGGLGYLY